MINLNICSLYENLITFNSIIAVITTIIAGLCRGFSGFGSSLVMTPVFATLYSPTFAVAMTLTLEIAISVDAVTRVFDRIPWRNMLPIWLGAWAATPLGTWMLLTADTDTFQRIISLIVASLAIILLMGWQYKGRRGIFSDLCIGLTSGALNSSTSLGGPPVLFYMLSKAGAAKTIRAAMISNVLVVSFPTVIVLLFNEILDWRVMSLSIILFPFYLISTFIGNRMFNSASQETYRRASAWLMLLIAAGTFLVG